MKRSDELTKRQSEAVETLDENVFVTAGAGTGKTRVLVNRYLELLRKRSVEVYRIVAVTYTRKAAKEMKDRIRQACLVEETASTGSKRRFWHDQRIALENARIGTIHSLCESILHLYPVEVGVDPGFTVLDEIEMPMLQRKVVDGALSALLDRDDAETIELIRVFGRQETASLMTELLQKRPRAVVAARQSSENPRKVVRQLKVLIQEANRKAADAIFRDQAFEKTLAVLSESGSKKGPDKLEAERVRLLELKRKLDASDDVSEQVALLSQMKVKAANRLGTKGNWDEADREAVRRAMVELSELLSGLGESVGEFDEEQLTGEQACAGWVAHVFLEVAKRYEQAKAERGRLDFDDLLLKTREFLLTNASGRRRLQERYEHVLVDELQDTSSIERDIVYLLCASDWETDDPEAVRLQPGKLFVVGDDKQSIYGFRGSEVTVFGDFRRRMDERGKVIELDRNFRSTSEGVRFANDLFERLMPVRADRQAFECEYRPLEAERAEGGEFAELLLAQVGPGEGMAVRRSAEASLIADRIHEMVLRERFAVKRSDGSGGSVRYGDIAVLFRALTSARIYEEALRDAGIPYYLFAGAGFYAAQEVRDVLNCLKALEWQSDEIALVGTLRSPMFGLSDEVIYLMQLSGSIEGALANPEAVERVSDEERRQIRRAGEVLGALRDSRNQMNVAELIEEVIERTGYDAVVLGQFMGVQKLANVEKLIDQARRFESSAGFVLNDFIEYMDEFVRAEARESERSVEEEEQDVVRLMTIHGAKGLEFPVVFVADMSRERKGHPRKIMLDGELGMAVSLPARSRKERGPLYRTARKQMRSREAAEELRLLYVALTRARDRLVLSGSESGESEKGDDWLKLILRTLSVSHVEDGSEIEFGSGSRLRMRTRPSGSVVSEEGQAQEAGWLGAQRLEKLVGGGVRSGVLPGELVERVGAIRPSLNAKRHFSVSELLTYQHCPKQYYWRYVLGLPGGARIGRSQERARCGAWIGTVVHRVLALWDLQDEAVLGSLVERAVAEIGPLGREDERVVGSEAERIVREGYGRGLFEDLRKAVRFEVEVPFVLEMNGNVVNGTVDRVSVFEDGGCEVVDYKTDRVGSGGVEAVAEAYRFQVGVYALAASRAFGAVRGGGVLLFSAGQWVRWEVTTEALDEVRREMSRCIAGIQAGRFEACTETCRYCGHAYVCEAGLSEASAGVEPLEF